MTTNASPGPVTSPSNRVCAALLATPRPYLRACLAQRVNGPNASGSVFTGFSDPVALLGELVLAEWEPYEHEAVMEGCTAFRAPLRGRIGVARLDAIDPETPVMLADPKRTGNVECTVRGVLGEEVDFAVIILGPDGGREVAYTFHPGAPIAPSRVPAADMDGRCITARDALAMGFAWAKIHHAEHTVPEQAPVMVRVELRDGGVREWQAFPQRCGWHCAPPCGATQPVYATPEDAAYAHARTLGLAVFRASVNRSARPSHP